MATPYLLLCCCLTFLTFSLVTSFSIRRRSPQGKDLAEALAILQRQRRRVGADFLTSDQLLARQPMIFSDVNDWLRESGPEGEGVPVEDLDPEWLPSDDHFKDAGFGEDVYDFPASKTPRPVQPSNDEINAIFNAGSTVSKRGRSDTDAYFPEKKKKEEMIDVKGDKTVLHKKSEIDLASDETSDSSGSAPDLSGLGLLTKEEINVLMKAVQKLQNNALKVSVEEKGAENMEDKTPSQSDEILVAEPVSDEELKSVFDSSEGPITKETSIIVEKQPGDKQAKVLKQETVSNGVLKGVSFQGESELSNALTDELEHEIEEEEAEEEEEAAAVAEAAEKVAEEEVALAAEETAEVEDALRPLTSPNVEDFTAENDDVIDDDDNDDVIDDDSIAEADADLLDDGKENLATKYWLMNRDNFDVPSHLSQKRTAKRAVDFTYPAFRDRRAPVDTEDGSIELNLSALSPSTRAFVGKILTLQGEVDRLKMLSRLEDMENDFLTDALNEATMAQTEGSVSNTEWTALQQAIKIEEALQQLNKGNNDVIKLGEDVTKRGEPWGRKREQLHEVSDDQGEPMSGVDYDSVKPRELSEARLLPRPRPRPRPAAWEDEEESKPVASLFMSDAGKCPAVQKYSTNCELASIYLLPIDFEARSLCNLHEMCYACGHSLGVSQSQCDIVYRAAGSTLCEREDDCVMESEIFLRAMKLKNRYVAHEQPYCQSTCTARFLGML